MIPIGATTTTNIFRWTMGYAEFMPTILLWFKNLLRLFRAKTPHQEGPSLEYTPPSSPVRLPLPNFPLQDVDVEKTPVTAVPVERELGPSANSEDPVIMLTHIADLDEEKRKIIWSILSVFETGKVDGDYAACSILADGAGLSYGKHQATDKSGTLDQICMRYLDKGGKRSEELKLLLDVLDQDLSSNAPPGQTPDEVSAKMQSYGMVDPKWTRVADLMRLLEQIGNEPEMKAAQDEVFAELYWEPCRSQCVAMHLELPLSWCAVYDTCIQSGPGSVARIRKLFGPSPPSGGGDEKAWTKAYLEARKAWIEGFSDPNPAKEKIVHSTSYRADAMLAMVNVGNWDLQTPIQIDKPRAVIK